jgi:hypothetical protein
MDRRVVSEVAGGAHGPQVGAIAITRIVIQVGYCQGEAVGAIAAVVPLGEVGG